MYRVVPKYTYSYKTYHIICFKKLVIVLVYKCLTVVIKTGQKKKSSFAKGQRMIHSGF